MDVPGLSLARGGVVLEVKVQPRASRDKVVAVRDGVLKITLCAPPVDGAANEACISVLARFLGVKKGRLEIISGHKGRRKRILVKEADLRELEACFASL